MAIESGTPAAGAVYSVPVTLQLKGLYEDYDYAFEAVDARGLPASGSMIALRSGPMVVYDSADPLRNRPDAGTIQIRRSVVSIAGATNASIVVRGKEPGGTVTLWLYSQFGRPLMQIGEAVTLDLDANAVVPFDGRLGGKPLPAGVYWVVATGAVSFRKPLVIATTGADAKCSADRSVRPL